uniref:Uncharacterized protein n=1 Tax=Octopus bimaculoides TaxID=37653 RepID=A0A0L8GGX0_OCTBM
MQIIYFEVTLVLISAYVTFKKTYEPYTSQKLKCFCFCDILFFTLFSFLLNRAVNRYHLINIGSV